MFCKFTSLNICCSWSVTKNYFHFSGATQAILVPLLYTVFLKGQHHSHQLQVAEIFVFSLLEKQMNTDCSPKSSFNGISLYLLLSHASLHKLWSILVPLPARGGGYKSSQQIGEAHFWEQNLTSVLEANWSYSQPTAHTEGSETFHLGVMHAWKCLADFYGAIPSPLRVWSTQWGSLHCFLAKHIKSQVHELAWHREIPA